MIEMNLENFLTQMASSAPVPGGGGASALAGAIGVALGNMVGSLTTGKKKYAHVETEIIELNQKSETLRKELLKLVEKDAEVFEPLSKAYSIPKDDPLRDQIMEKALREASDVPLAIMEKCCQAIDIIAEYADKGSKLVISDAGCAAAMAKGALESAALNVYINTKAMKDQDMAATMNERVSNMLNKYCNKADHIYNEVSRRLING